VHRRRRRGTNELEDIQILVPNEAAAWREDMTGADGGLIAEMCGSGGVATGFSQCENYRGLCAFFGLS
jgi:hypothetical protein